MDVKDNPIPPDRLNEMGVLKRREIEARILGPLIKRLGNEFGRERVLDITRATVVEIAQKQGADLVESMGGCSLIHFAASLEAWLKDDALQMDVLQQDDQEFRFNVTRCHYAEMYRALGIPELGAVLSCSRDAALIEGFNPAIRLTRTHTLMDGAEGCDFRYVVEFPK
jgi:hypothetical protein